MPSGVQRKVVTVLFCDVVGSTSLGETTDPEALRMLLAGYFERTKAIVERHGGTVEKFIGDAVMAVFGIPVAHEDDALRACRAALEMQEAFPDLEVEGRIGITTGEVVTGTEERLATGDPVNVAARLQQTAEPGHALLDEPTLQLVRAATEVEPLEPLELKGKAESVAAFRLLSVREPERLHETSFVGREGELATIHEAWQRALAERRCELMTIVGEAGVGKSRLVAEAFASVGTRIVQGRCLPYGEGITYWPVIEVVKQLHALPSDPAAVASIRSLLRETEEETSAEEIAWAFRKLLEEQAPLICVFDDTQSGEETFLDLVEHVALLSTGAPLLLLCMARPELVERRPTWPVTLRLDSLAGEDVDELIGDQVPAELRERIARASGGNPLFVSEILAMAGEADGEVTVPPTLRALLAARIDQLESGERGVLERGAVEGEIFHRGAVRALSESEPVTPRLASLVRKKLIRPEAAQIPGEDAFRFHHLLLRDAAYDALPKGTRAELHERFSRWLEERGGELVELDEILGFHLEQAAGYKAELGWPDPVLSERAGERLAVAGRRALWRADQRAASRLLERALDLTRPLHLEVNLECDLARATNAIDPRKGAMVAERAAQRALAAEDEAGAALSQLIAGQFRLDFAPDSIDEVQALAETALPLIQRAGDDEGLVHVWWAIGSIASFRGRFEESARAQEEASRHATIAGQPSRRDLVPSVALMLGPTPADEALRKVEAVTTDVSNPGAQLTRAVLLAMLGRFDEAWPLGQEAVELFRELSGDGAGEWALADIATLAGDLEATVEHLRRQCDFLETIGHSSNLSTQAPQLGRSLCALGRHDEAEPLAHLARELGHDDDVMTQALWRQVQALIHAQRSDQAQAKALAREAVEITERTDGLNLQGDALWDLAEVLQAGGRAAEATAALERALDRYGRKRNLVMAERTRAKVAELRSATRT